MAATLIKIDNQSKKIDSEWILTNKKSDIKK